MVSFLFHSDNPFFNSANIEKWGTQNLQWLALTHISKDTRLNHELRHIALEKLNYFKDPSEMIRKNDFLKNLNSNQKSLFAMEFATKTFTDLYFDSQFLHYINLELAKSP